MAGRKLKGGKGNEDSDYFVLMSLDPGPEMGRYVSLGKVTLKSEGSLCPDSSFMTLGRGPSQEVLTQPEFSGTISR